MDIAGKNLYYHHISKNDGRSLHLYGNNPIKVELTHELEALEPQNSQHLRWHPLRQQWVGYATARQNRTFNPPKEYCPLCPVKKGATAGEIAVEDFEIAIFDNRFSSLSLDATIAEHFAFKTKPAIGKCEVIVYSARHDGNLGQMSDDHRALLIQAWIHRYNELRENPELRFVFPFENRGKEVGVTLPHPHGQLYGFNFLPPTIEKMKAAFEDNQKIMFEIYQQTGGENDLYHDDYAIAFVPEIARYPFETWIMPKEPVAGPWQFSGKQLSSFAKAQGVVQRKLDAVFNCNMPYIMGLYAAPSGYDDIWHFHIQYMPFLRGEHKLKYLAGIEQSMDFFLMDNAPSDMAKTLQAVKVSI